MTLFLPGCREVVTVETQPEDLPGDSRLHTDEHPFCGDCDCDCHNSEAVAEYIDPYLDEGTMSNGEAIRRYFGK